MRLRFRPVVVLAVAATVGLCPQAVALGEATSTHGGTVEAGRSTPWPYGDPVADGTVTQGAGSERREAHQSAPANTTDFEKAGGNLANQNYSDLAQIAPRNIDRLGAAWHLDLDPAGAGGNQQSTAIVSGGVMYVQTSKGEVHAVEATTGQPKWTYKPDVGGERADLRGAAVGGGRVYTTLPDKDVAAVDEKTGRELWRVTLGGEPGFEGIAFLPAAVVYYDGLIYVGTGGSGRGYRGRGYAIDARTGKVKWAFWGTAAPGSPGNEDGKSWEGDSWKTGGAMAWMHPAVDPELDTVYWTFANPDGPEEGEDKRTDGSGRGGDNLYANSIVAMDVHTGKYKWHFQSVHHDIWDADNAMAPVLGDVTVDGKLRKAVFYGSKTGMIYTLDRRTGKPIIPVHELPVPQYEPQKTSPTQPFPEGDSITPLCPEFDTTMRPVPHYETGCIFTPFGTEPMIGPGTGGGADWSAMSFNRQTGLIYIGASEINSFYTQGQSDVHGDPVGRGLAGFTRPYGELRSGRVVALDPRTNRIAWYRKTTYGLSNGNGMLSTKSGLVFFGQPDGLLKALDASTGEELWQFQTGAGVHTSPITYTVAGQQYVAVFAGGSGIPYSSPKGQELWAFKIGGTVPQAEAPPAPSVDQPISGTEVSGSTVDNTIVLGRVWDTTTGGPGATEQLDEQNAFAPNVLRVPVGTTVKFVNPAGNRQSHCADSFFDYEFDTGPIAPGDSIEHTFKKKGTYKFNDCVFPAATGRIIVE